MVEVAARVVHDVLDYLGVKGIARPEFMAVLRERVAANGDDPNDLSDAALERRGHHVSWASFTHLLDLWSEVVGGEAAEREFCRRAYTTARGRWTKILPYVLGLVTTPLQLYRLSARASALNFPGLKFEQAVLPDGRYTATMTANPGDRGCSTFFRLNGFNCNYVARLIGCVDAVVEAEVGPHRGRYLVILPPSRALISRTLRYVRGILDVRSLLRHLSEREERVRQSYDRLLDAHSRLEERVSVSEQALERGLSAIAEVERIAQLGSWELDLKTDLYKMSEECRRIFGIMTDQEFVSRPEVAWKVPPEGRALIRSALSRTLEHGDDIDLEHDVATPDGGPRVVHARGVLVRDALGRPERIVGTVQDVTLRKSYERSITQARDIADAANRMKSVFLANISHEIRTPMTAILGFADVIAGPDLAPDVRANCQERLRRNGLHLLALIDDILDLSRIEAGRLTLNQSVFDPRSEMTLVVESLRPQAAVKGLALALVVEAGVPTAISSDPVRFRQILMNIIANALKFTDQGRVTVAAKPVPGPGGTLLEVRVKDSGIGIPLESRHLLFQPFSQAHLQQSARGGTGLGLALTQHIARAMGGDVALAASAPGVGSEFVVTLPLTLDGTT